MEYNLCREKQQQTEGLAVVTQKRRVSTNASAIRIILM